MLVGRLCEGVAIAVFAVEAVGRCAKLGGLD